MSSDTPPPTAAAQPEWRQLSAAGASPAAREDHTWTVDPSGTHAYLFGGRSGRQEFDDLWRYDLAADAWTQLEAATSPPARFGHVATWAEGLGLVIWSGQSGPDFFADVWVYDADAEDWRELPATGDVPPARYGSCGGIGPDGRLWISHGFTADGGRFADTRAYEFTTGEWQDVTPEGQRPVERCLHDCLWTADGRLVLYAGQTTGVPAIGDLWTLDQAAGSWTEAAQPEPAPRQLYALAAAGTTAYVFGGGSRDGEMLGDLWQLDLDALTWQEPQVQGTPPAARAGATLVADVERDRVLLFGGKSAAGELNDLWQLSPGAAK